MTAQVAHLAETTEQHTSLLACQVSGRAIEIAEALSAQAIRQDRPVRGMPPPPAEMADMSVGGLGNVALVHGGNPSAWLCPY